ncbi:hypothetical protein ACLKA6_001481 [Drosophila palustris]
MITSKRTVRENDRYKSGGSDESDGEERELTNLNWLLRNQNVTWPKTIDGNSEDDVNHNTQITAPLKKANTLDHTSKSTAKKCITPHLVSCAESKRHSGTTAAVAPSKRLSPAERYDIFINKIKRDLAEYEKSAVKYKTDVSEKPPFNYSHIIGMAMLENGRVTLQQICAWIESKFAFFRARKKWNNSIRHNLSLHHCFRNRKREEKGKGGYWELGVDPKKCDRKRIRNRKTGQSKLISKKLQICENIPSAPANGEENPMQLCYRQIPDNFYMGTQSAVEVGLNMDHEPDPDPDGTFLMSANEEEQGMQQQYELGTIIISTTGIIDDSSCLNGILNNKFSCTNMIYTEDEIPMSSENVIMSTDADIALVTPAVSSPELLPSSLAHNWAYIDGVDESFGYLHSTEINRSEDILDNLLDVCVRDY